MDLTGSGRGKTSPSSVGHEQRTSMAREELVEGNSLLRSTAKQVHNILPLPADFHHVKKVKGLIRPY